MIYVDDMAIKKNAKVWYHLMSNENNDEIHTFAARLGLKRIWYHVDHYDLVQSKYQQAVIFGAMPISAKEMVKIRKQLRKAVTGKGTE